MGYSRRSKSVRGSLAALAAIAIWYPAYAVEPKPDFAIKTKSIETSVSLDAKIKADAALARIPA